VNNIVVLVLALLPIMANASCTVEVNGNVMTLNVKESKTCMNTPETREAFKSALKVSLANLEPSRNSSSRSTIARQTAKQKIYNFTDLETQAKHLSPGAPTYYGQQSFPKK
jgi:hypothetical protein